MPKKSDLEKRVADLEKEVKRLKDAPPHPATIIVYPQIPAPHPVPCPPPYSPQYPWAAPNVTPWLPSGGTITCSQNRQNWM